MAIKTRIFRMGVAVVAVLACSTFWLWFTSYNSRFGQVAITLPNGSTIYAVRETWGMNGNRLSLTQNPDGCLPANPATDYIETSGTTAALTYSTAKDGIVLYEDEGVNSIKQPTIPWSKIKVILKHARYPSVSTIMDEPQKYGVKVEPVPLNRSCWKNWFRKVERSPLGLVDPFHSAAPPLSLAILERQCGIVRQKQNPQEYPAG